MESLDLKNTISEIKNPLGKPNRRMKITNKCEINNRFKDII